MSKSSETKDKKKQSFFRTRNLLPKSFEIYEDNAESLTSWFYAIKQKMMPVEPSPVKHNPGELATSFVGNNFYLAQKREKIPFSDQSKLMTDFNAAITSEDFSSNIDITTLE